MNDNKNISKNDAVFMNSGGASDATFAARDKRAQISQEASQVLRNTYALLALTIMFSAVTASVSIAIGMPYMGLWTLLPYFALLFAVAKTQNSAWGLLWVFALTGWLGITIGPILSMVIGLRGYEPIFMALVGTAAIFFTLSGYILITRKDLSFMTGFLFIGILIAFLAGIANYFLQIQGLYLAVSCVFLLLSSALIMWQTSAIIHGGERNYIAATVTLYVMLYNIFSILVTFFASSSDD